MMYFTVFCAGVRRRVIVEVNDRRFFYASDLVEGARYNFSVIARTDKGWGPARYGEVTTGPQPGNYTLITLHRARF